MGDEMNEFVQTPAPTKITEIFNRCIELVGSGANEAQLRSALSELDPLLTTEGGEAKSKDYDIYAVLSWLLNVKIGPLKEFLGRSWVDGESERVRRRFLLLKNGHALAAGAARRKRASQTQPEYLRSQVQLMMNSSEVKTKRQAYIVLGKRLNKSPEYLEKRARNRKV